MAGHSKWNNIKRTKGVQDAKRGNLFSKLSRNIFITAKIGGADPGANPLLKDAIQRAKSFSMPGDKIEKAINKATGKNLEGKKMVEKMYEIYGVGGEATFLVECYTDNPNRILNELKEIVFRNNAKIVPEGAISWNYQNYIQIELAIKANIDKDALVFQLLEYKGVEDIESDETNITILAIREQSSELINTLKTRQDIQIKEIESIMLAKDSISLNNELLEANQKVLNQIEEL